MITVTTFEQEVQHLRPQLLNEALCFYHDRQRAEDAVQEVFARLWMLRHRLDDDAPLAPLCRRMVRNYCVSQWRKEQKTSLQPIDDRRQPMTTVPEPEGDDWRALLQQALATLTPAEQRLFHLRQDLEMDISQIAAVTGLLPRSVSAVVSSARRKLLNELKEKGVL